MPFLWCMPILFLQAPILQRRNHIKKFQRDDGSAFLRTHIAWRYACAGRYDIAVCASEVLNQRFNIQIQKLKNKNSFQSFGTIISRFLRVKVSPLEGEVSCQKERNTVFWKIKNKSKTGAKITLYRSCRYGRIEVKFIIVIPDSHAKTKNESKGINMSRSPAWITKMWVKDFNLCMECDGSAGVFSQWNRELDLRKLCKSSYVPGSTRRRRKKRAGRKRRHSQRKINSPRNRKMHRVRKV